MNKEELIKALAELNIQLTETKWNQLQSYQKLLAEWNQVMNLTGITDPEGVNLKHYYDSATLVKAIPISPSIKICDIGTGAGFPGLVLKILFPEIEVVLVDSLEKRLKFLDHVIEQLELRNIKTVHARAEEYARDHRDQFDVVTTRAVAKLNILVEYCIPLVKQGGIFVAMKGKLGEEKDQSINAIQQVGSKIESIISFKLPKEESERNLVIVRKIEPTNKKFPRRFEQIKKKPL